MGKNIRHQESTNVPLQNGNHAGRMNRVLHALKRRHRWQNVQKVLPNKRQGTGKHIIGKYDFLLLHVIMFFDALLFSSFSLLPRFSIFFGNFMHVGIVLLI